MLGMRDRSPAYASQMLHVAGTEVKNKDAEKNNLQAVDTNTDLYEAEDIAGEDLYEAQESPLPAWIM